MISERNLYRFMVLVIIVAIIKLLIAEDYGSIVALIVGLVSFIQDLRNQALQEAQSTQETSAAQEGESE